MTPSFPTLRSSDLGIRTRARDRKSYTFSNEVGGVSFFKAVGHPLTAEALAGLLDRRAGLGPAALYDPMGHLGTLAELHDLSRLTVAGVFVQAVERIGESVLGHVARPVTELPSCPVRAVLIAGFDAGRAANHIRHLLPAGAEIATLDSARLPAAMLSNPRRYQIGRAHVELQSLMRISYAVFCLKKQKKICDHIHPTVKHIYADSCSHTA